MAAPRTTIFSFPRSFSLSPNALTAALQRRALTAGKYIARRSLAFPTHRLEMLPNLSGCSIPDAKIFPFGRVTGAEAHKSGRRGSSVEIAEELTPNWASLFRSFDQTAPVRSGKGQHLAGSDVEHLQSYRRVDPRWKASHCSPFFVRRTGGSAN